MKSLPRILSLILLCSLLQACATSQHQPLLESDESLNNSEEYEDSSQPYEFDETVELMDLAQDAELFASVVAELDQDSKETIAHIMRAAAQPLPTVEDPKILTLAQLDNLLYHMPEGSMQLRDGCYFSLLHFYGKDIDYWRMHRDLRRGVYIASDSEDTHEDHAFGDLNADGWEDAAVILREHFGGSGVDIYLAVVMNENGVPRNTSIETLGDRQEIQTVAIKQGRIHLTGFTHRDYEGLMQPTLTAEWVFEVRDGKLEIISMPTQKAFGRMPYLGD